jgi:polyisoprenoid-binding protein YceI
MRRRWVPWLVGVPLALGALVTGGTWLYINVIQEDPPERLRLDASPTSTAPVTSTGPAGGADGVWRVGPGSVVGYRVKEILFGQDNEAVGRTSEVDGAVRIDGTTVVSAEFTADLTTVTSDESRRDNQFRGRIMDVATYPTATFRLTSSIALGSIPPEGRRVTVEVSGELTLRGTTRPVRFRVEAERSSGTIRVAGSIPITFADWGIPNPSFGPISTEDHGELEFLLVLKRE